MHKTLTLTTAVLLLSAGAVAHASSPTAREMMNVAREAQAPQTPAELVHDLRVVLHHAGFHVVHAERGIPGRAGFVHVVERVDYQRKGVCPKELRGFDVLRDYLSTSFDGWGAVHPAGSATWIWRDPIADESVTLWYAPARCGARPGARAAGTLVIAHYNSIGR